MVAHTIAPLHAPLHTELDPLHLATAGFLARYGPATRRAYSEDIRTYLGWCSARQLHPFSASRAHLEVYVRWMQEERRYAPKTVARRFGTVSSWYRFAVIDGLTAANPAEYVRRPTQPDESQTLGLSHLQFEKMLAISRDGTPVDHALVVMLGLLGLRVSEACAASIEHLGSERGHRTLRVVLGKGGKPAVIPLPPPVARAVDLAAAARPAGPILTTRTGRRLDRSAATRITTRIARAANIPFRVHPHVLRHTFVTTMLDAGVPLRDVQIAARHSDPRMTIRYDRARNNLDRHANYILSAFMSGAA